MASQTRRLGEFLVEAETRDELEPRAHEAKIDASRFLSAGTAIVDSGLASGAESNSLPAPYRKAEIHVVREDVRA